MRYVYMQQMKLLDEMQMADIKLASFYCHV